MSTRSTPPVPPATLARRARILGLASAPLFAAVAVGFIALGLGFSTILVAGLTLLVLAALLVVAAFTGARAVRWAAFTVALVGAATACVLVATSLPSDAGIAMTYLLGILPILALACFIVFSVSRAAQTRPD